MIMEIVSTHLILILIFIFLQPHVFSVRNTTIFNNVGKYGVALYFDSLDGQQTNFEIINCTFANHTAFSSDYYKKST